VLSTLLEWQPQLAPQDVRRARTLAATDLRHPVFRHGAAGFTSRPET